MHKMLLNGDKQNKVSWISANGCIVKIEILFFSQEYTQSFAPSPPPSLWITTHVNSTNWSQLNAQKMLKAYKIIIAC